MVEEGGCARKLCAEASTAEANECLGSWLAYLQMLNSLCTAGARLALSLQSGPQCRLASQCLAGWEELARATAVASRGVGQHVAAALRDLEARDSQLDKAAILRDSLLTFVNLQYQFCVACCQCLGGMAECSCAPDAGQCDVAALRQCFERLCSPPPQQTRAGQRSPQPCSLFPLQVQRRWSETAAADMTGAESAEQTARRWSMPWDCRPVGEWPRATERVRGPRGSPEPAWRSAASSQDGLREAIQLLSCRPGVRPASSTPRGPPSGLTLSPAWPTSSRKDSSSTDSSCVSAHSRSGSEGAPAESMRSNTYSMWSGSDLPFIKLPDSSDVKDDSIG